MINNFTGEYAFLSNYYDPCSVLVGGRKYRNSEAAYQAQKCRNENEKDNFTLLAPDTAKLFGKHVTVIPDWDEKKVGAMRRVIHAKFSQHPDLAERLYETKDEELVEGNDWHDNFFGDCFCRKCRNIPGQNWLGRILMEERRRIHG